MVNRIEKPSVRTQFLVFTLFGDYFLSRGGRVWTSQMLRLLGLLGVSERAARSTLSRMAQKGWLTASKHGRRSRYAITPRGWMLLTQGEKRIFEPMVTDWDGLWQVVVYSLPEKERRLRHSLRQGLTWLGFGSLAPGTWISPHNRKIEVKNYCNELGIQQYVEIFSGVHMGLSLDKDLVQRCWDFEKIADNYQKFIEQYEAAYENCQNGNIPSPKDCFVERFWITHHFQSFPREDPNLPTALLPSNWIGLKARTLFENYRQLLEVRANQYADEIIGKERAGVSEPQANIFNPGSEPVSKMQERPSSVETGVVKR